MNYRIRWIKLIGFLIAIIGTVYLFVLDTPTTDGKVKVILGLIWIIGGTLMMFVEKKKGGRRRRR